MKLTVNSTDTATCPAEWFTGDGYIDGIRNPDDQSAIGCAHVRFTPGARTPGITTPRARRSTSPTASGTSPDAAVSRTRSAPGDVAHIEPGEEHWHGATAGRLWRTSPPRKPTTTAKS